MTKTNAIAAAQRDANESGVILIVTFNPYDPDNYEDADRYGYHPKSAAHLFPYEEPIQTIRPS